MSGHGHAVRCLLVLTAIAVGGCSVTRSEQLDYRPIHTLYELFETTYFAEGAFFSNDARLKLSPSARNGLKVPYALLLSALKQTSLQPLRDIVLKDGGIDNILVGARNFAFTDGLGPVSFDACYIIKTSREIPALRTLLTFDPEVQYDGRPIWMTSFTYGGDRPQPITASITQTGRYIVLGTRSDVTSIVAGRLTGSSPSPTGSVKLRDFPEILSAPAWGYRNYRSSYRGEFRDYIEDIQVDRNATGLLFWVDQGSNSVHLRYMTETDERTPTRFRDMPFSEVQAGVWETRFELLDTEERGNRLFASFWLLGFGFVV